MKTFKEEIKQKTKIHTEKKRYGNALKMDSDILRSLYITYRIYKLNLIVEFYNDPKKTILKTGAERKENIPDHIINWVQNYIETWREQ